MNTLRVLAIAMLAAVPPAAVGQTFPTKPIRFIVPYVPGGGTDLIARLLGQKLNEAWGQQVIIDNRPGAQGNIGQALAAKARPDGYTIVLATTAALGINPIIYRSPGFDAARDYAPVALVTQQPYFIVVHPSLPARSVQELIAYSKTHPDKLNFGTSGALPQLGGELLKTMSGMNMTHVPYPGAGPALLGLMANQLHLTITTPAGPLPYIRGGRLRLLAVTSASRVDIVPDVPTVAESGVPGYEVIGWYGILAPARTPADIIVKLNAEIAQAMRAPEIKAVLAQEGMQTAGGTPKEFASYLDSEIKKWGKITRDSGLRID